MNICVAQSGGPTAAINASLAGVIKEGFALGHRVFGAKNGIDGVLRDRVCDLCEIFGTDEYALKLLALTPSTALGSCRIRLKNADEDSSQYEKIFSTLERYEIGAFYYIGGNDSMDTVMKLSAYGKTVKSPIRFIGIPKTIDDDMPLCDHTPGFGSAAKYLCATVKEIISDSRVYNLPSVTVVEVMGRDAGWLAASTVLLRESCAGAPHLIYLPERPFSFEQFLSDVKAVQKEHKAVIVAVSEGLKLRDGNYAAGANLSGKSDVFGHQYLAGLGKTLERFISAELLCKARSVELNVCQRAASHLASKTDLLEAEKVAAAAVRAGTNGESGKVMTIKRVSDLPYSVEFVPEPAELIANKEKPFPTEWINAEGNGVVPEAISYFLPLIQGEAEAVYKNGIPEHFVIPGE